MVWYCHAQSKFNVLLFNCTLLHSEDYSVTALFCKSDTFSRVLLKIPYDCCDAENVQVYLSIVQRKCSISSSILLV